MYCFAIQWFYFCKNKLHVLKKNTSQPPKIQLQSLGRLTRAPVATSCTCLSSQQREGRPTRRTGLVFRASQSVVTLCVLLSPAQLPGQASLCPPAWCSARQPRKSVKLFSPSSPRDKRVEHCRAPSTSWFSWHLNKSKNRKQRGRRKVTSWNLRRETGQGTEIGSRTPGRGWGMMGWYCHLVAAWYSGKNTAAIPKRRNVFLSTRGRTEFCHKWARTEMRTNSFCFSKWLPPCLVSWGRIAKTSPEPSCCSNKCVRFSICDFSRYLPPFKYWLPLTLGLSDLGGKKKILFVKSEFQINS